MIKFKVILLIILLACSVCFGYGDSEETDEIEQYGIIWTFDAAIAAEDTGTYANGDHWVVGPVDIIDIFPNTVDSAGRIINGSMLDVSSSDGQESGWTTTWQGFDTESESVTAGSYYTADPAHQNHNVAWGVDSENPLTVSAGSSLLSCKSKVPSTSWRKIEDMAILTVVTSAPAANSYRPAYCGPKTTYSADNPDLSIFESLSTVTGAPSHATVVAMIKRPWLDFFPGDRARLLRAENNAPDYGNDIAVAVGTITLSLNLDYTDEEKQEILDGFVQYGIDLWGVMLTGGFRGYAPYWYIEGAQWSMDGGHGPGRKLPILIAGHVLDHAGMKAIGDHDTDDPAFGEDQTTLYIYRAYVEVCVDGEGLYAHPYPPGNPHWDDEDAYYDDPGDYQDRKVDPTLFAAWGATTAYVYGDYVTHGGNYYRAKTASYNTTFHTETFQAAVEPGVDGDTLEFWIDLETVGSVIYEGIPEYGKEYYEREPEANYRAISKLADAGYRDPQLGQGIGYYGLTTAAMIMELQDDYNHAAMFDYIDRITDLTATGGDWDGTFIRTGTAFHANMYDTYRAIYGPVWPEPTWQSTSVVYSSIQDTSYKIDWTVGGGTKRIVVMKEGSACDVDPVDGVSPTANATFGSGTHLGEGNYVVYMGSSDTVTVTGLSESTEYHIAVYEYINSGSDINFLLISPLRDNQETSGDPPPTIDTITALSADGNSAEARFTLQSANGTVSATGFFYNTTGAPITENDTAGDTLAEGFVDATLSTLAVNTLHYFRGYATNEHGTNYTADDTVYTSPDTQPTSLVISAVTDTTLTLAWTEPSGGHTGVVVFMKANSSVDSFPVDFTQHTANAAFGSGEEVGSGNFTMYLGTGETVDITGLTIGTTYYVRVCSYTATGTDTNYFTGGTPLTGSQTTTGGASLGPYYIFQ